MKNLFFLLLLLAFTSCSDKNSISDALDVSNEISEANQAIEDTINLSKTNDIESELDSTDFSVVDGPFPADEYSFNKNKKFFFYVLFNVKADSVWMLIKAKNEAEITDKYPKLKAFKVRPEKFSRDYWINIQRNSLDQQLVFDIEDEATGWLKENEKLIR